MKRRKYNRIKIVITQYECTGRSLATWLGKSDAAVSSWARNKTQPSIPDLYRIAEYFDISVCELLVPVVPGFRSYN